MENSPPLIYRSTSVSKSSHPYVKQTMSCSTPTEQIYSMDEYDYASTNTSRDPRDDIIRQNQRQMLLMQRNFKQSAQELRMQLRDYAEQSMRVQDQMLDRILQLKSQIKAIQDRQEFFKRKLPTEKSSSHTLRKKKITKKSSSK